MSHDQLNQIDKLSQLCNPIMMVVLIALAFIMIKNAAWPFLLRNGLAIVLVQQISKYVQKHGAWGDDFPSTHFAVALAVSVGLIVLNRRLWPLACVYIVGYGSLVLFRHYHTPFEMVGALFAVPLTLLFHWKPRRNPTEAAAVINN